MGNYRKNEKDEWEKIPWRELPEDEKNRQETWKSYVEYYCPLTRKPCWEKIDPTGPDTPDNNRCCRFWEWAWEECRLTAIFERVEELLDHELQKREG